MRKRWNPLGRSDLAIEIGARIRKARLDRGWSQATLASKLEIPKRSIIKYETGALIPPVYTLYQLAGVFGVDLNSLLADLPQGVAPVTERLSIQDYLRGWDFLSPDDRQILAEFLTTLLGTLKRLQAAARKRF